MFRFFPLRTKAIFTLFLVKDESSWAIAVRNGMFSVQSITHFFRYSGKSRERVKETFDSQKQLASSLNVPVPIGVSEQIVKQSKEMTNDFERATRSNNQLGVRVQDAFTDYNNSMLNAWASYWGSQQQQVIRA